MIQTIAKAACKRGFARAPSVTLPSSCFWSLPPECKFVSINTEKCPAGGGGTLLYRGSIGG